MPETIEQRRVRNYSNQQRYLKRNAEYVLQYFKEHPCVDCGEIDPVVLDFDHRDPSKKKVKVSRLIACSLKELKSEISKCEVRCSNCHRRKHAIENNEWRVRLS